MLVMLFRHVREKEDYQLTTYEHRLIDKQDYLRSSSVMHGLLRGSTVDILDSSTVPEISYLAEI